MLTSAKLVFRGVADVEVCKGSQVPCGLWYINRQDEANLDSYEGIASKMYRKVWVTMTHLGRKRKALIYLMNSRGVMRPLQYYIDVIREGYRDFGLDESYLNEAIIRSFDKEPDEQTIARRKRQKADPRHRDLVKIPDKVWKRHLENLAREHINKYIGDVASEYSDEEEAAKFLHEEAYILGHDALINNGVSDDEAAVIAGQIAKEYESFRRD
jgi:hypothetical protein